MNDCTKYDLNHEWYNSGAMQECYHCEQFQIADPPDELPK